MLRQAHSLCLLEHSSDYDHLYKILGRCLAEGYAVVYACEPDPDQVIRRMAKAGVEVGRYIENGMLKVLPWESVYVSKEKFDLPGTLESWRNIISEMTGRTNAKGIVAIGSVDVLIKHSEQEQVVEYEKAIGKKFQTPTEAVCCYNADSLSDSSVSVLIDILNAHQYVIHDNAEYSEWEDGKLQTVMTSAFSKVMGATTSDLVLKSLKSIYRLDGKSIISQPEILENVVGKFFKDSAPPILAAVLKDLKSEVAFRRQPAGLHAV
jgi:hypothetical protein